MTVEGGWLVVNFYDPLTFTSNIMYAKRKETLGLNALPGPLVWHGAEIQIPYEEVTHMVVNAASGVPRLWIATIVRSNTGGDTVGDVKLYWAPVTDGESPLKNWQNGGHMQFATDWDLTLPADDVDDATSPKVVMRFDVLADNLGITGGDLVQIGVQVANVLNADGTEDAAFNSYSASAGGSPRSTLYPLDQGREYIQAYRPVFKIVGTGNEDGPAALRALKVRVGKILELRETLKYRVSLGGGRLKSGAQDTRDPKVLKAFLVNLQRRGPVQMVNEHGETVTVKVEYGVKYIVSNDPLNDSREEEAEFIVTKITQDQAVSGGSSDEDADRYDSDLVWADTDGTASGETAVWQ